MIFQEGLRKAVSVLWLFLLVVSCKQNQEPFNTPLCFPAWCVSGLTCVPCPGEVLYSLRGTDL